MGGNCELTLFGGSEGWNASDWIASDDRVRGGKSQSYLDKSGTNGRFYGTLDIKTLGGAGFASQRTSSDDASWNLSEYDGIRIDLGKSDGKRYTFTIKDTLLPPDPNTGRDQAVTSYEYDFNVTESAAMAETSFVFATWDEFTATYRGKEKPDAPKLNTKDIKRFSVMMRSFFGDQEGDFSLTLKSIKAMSVPLDPEEGFGSEKDHPRPKRRSIATLDPVSSMSMLVAFAGLGFAVYGVCFYACAWITGKKIMWPWQV